jgi:signal transduction histidine kinase
MTVDALAAAISHEIGQPLAAVALSGKSALRLLSAEPPNLHRAITSLRDNIEAGDLAMSVVKSLRAAFAGRSGERTSFDLADLVRSTVPTLQRDLESERISLQLALDAAPSTVLADRVQLQRVLVNLLVNAVEALRGIEDRPRRIAIRTARQGNGGVLLEISDNGAGIAPGDMARIFDPFFTTKPTGTGLGLSLCRLIVEAHGGHLRASRGEEDYGATFHIELPLG